MWDADLVSRVRDRKLNEIMIFASMAKIDSSNIDTYIDIIVSLGDDIDACDTLLDTDGESEIALESIDEPEYTGRLSPGEKADEDAFNALKSSPRSGGDSPQTGRGSFGRPCGKSQSGSHPLLSECLFRYGM